MNSSLFVIFNDQKFHFAFLQFNVSRLIGESLIIRANKGENKGEGGKPGKNSGWMGVRVGTPYNPGI